MIDIKDFYLNTPMKKYKYTQLKISEIPDKTIIATATSSQRAARSCSRITAADNAALVSFQQS